MARVAPWRHGVMNGEHVIKMPDVGEGIVEVELVAWRVQVGEQIAEDQIVADVMTDKATVGSRRGQGQVLALVPNRHGDAESAPS